MKKRKYSAPEVVAPLGDAVSFVYHKHSQPEIRHESNYCRVEQGRTYLLLLYSEVRAPIRPEELESFSGVT